MSWKVADLKPIVNFQSLNLLNSSYLDIQDYSNCLQDDGTILFQSIEYYDAQ